MLETAPFAPTLTTSLADADTLRYYPAYEAAPLSRLGQQGAVAADHHLQLLLVQRPDGGLTIGDTHAYGEPFDFALCEDPTDELLCPGQEDPRRGRSHPCGAAGRVSTPSASTAGSACARRSARGSGWSPGPAGGA